MIVSTRFSEFADAVTNMHDARLQALDNGTFLSGNKKFQCFLAFIKVDLLETKLLSRHGVWLDRSCDEVVIAAGADRNNIIGSVSLHPGGVEGVRRCGLYAEDSSRESLVAAVKSICQLFEPFTFRIDPAPLSTDLPADDCVIPKYIAEIRAKRTDPREATPLAMAITDYLVEEVLPTFERHKLLVPRREHCICGKPTIQGVPIWHLQRTHDEGRPSWWSWNIMVVVGTCGDVRCHTRFRGRLELIMEDLPKVRSRQSVMCSQCNSPNSKGNKMKLCARCASVGYCCKECQTKHWFSIHKYECCYVRDYIQNRQPREGDIVG